MGPAKFLTCKFPGGGFKLQIYDIPENAYRYFEFAAVEENI
jgi:hypothetical protein